MVNKYGEYMDLTVGSPTTLKHYMANQYTKNQHDEINTLFKTRGRLKPGQEIDPALLRFL